MSAVLRKRKGPTPAWWTLLNEAVTIITREREIAFDSFSDAKGRVTGLDERAEIRRYDRFLKAARAELIKRHRV
jgi:hypothetical protein